MGHMSYEEACEAGYDGPSPSEERRLANRRRRNAMLDPRDPDYDETLEEGYSEEEPEAEEPDDEEEQDDESDD